MTKDTNYTDQELKNDIVELMTAWNKIEQAAKEQFPGLDADAIYKITAGAMNHALGIAHIAAR